MYEVPNILEHQNGFLPYSLPSMLPPSYSKSEQALDQYFDDDLLNPFNLTYAKLAGIDMPTGQQQNTQYVNHTKFFTRSHSSPHF